MVKLSNIILMRGHLFARLIVLGVIFVSQLPAPSPLYASSHKKNLLIINSYDESAPWIVDYITPFMQEVSTQEQLNCDMFHMNSTLIRTDSMYHVLANRMFSRYKRNHPDYLVIIGKMAFSLRDRIKKEWGNVPMLFMGEDDQIIPDEKYLSGDCSYLTRKRIPLSDIRSRYNFTYIEMPDLYKETIDMMVSMQPELKTLIFTSDDLAPNVRLDSDIRKYIAVRYPQIKYKWLIASEKTFYVIQKYLRSKDMSLGILLSSWNYSRPSAFGYPVLVTRQFKNITSAPHPVFSLKEYNLSTGAIGGCFTNDEAIITNCLSALRKMLETGDVRQVPFSYVTEKYPKVNYTRLQDGMISETKCPENTIFINKPKSLFETYSSQFLFGGVLLVLATCSFAGLYMSQRRRNTIISSHDKLLDNMPICYMKGNFIQDSTGKVIAANIGYCNHDAEVLVAKNSENDTRNNLFDHALFIGCIEQLLESKENIHYTHYFARTDTYYYILICRTLNSNEVDIFGVDITDRVKAQKSLQETGAALEMSLAVAHIIPWKWDLKKHVIACEAGRIMKHINIPVHSDSTMFTHVIDEKDYFDRIHPEDQSKIKHLYRSLVDGSKHYVKAEFRVISENGGKRIVDWMEVCAGVSKYDSQQRPVELIGSLLLITTRKRQEASLIAARESAKESDRLKSAFLANMSHEIRTPLNAIVGFSNLLTTTQSDEKKQKFVKIIENNNRLLLQLISDILDLSKVEANTFDFIYKPVDLNELMSGINETMLHRVQPGVELNYTQGADDCCIETEPNRLSQIIGNLLTNACKFTREGSITFGYEVRESNLYFFVRDTGCGISKEGCERIFKPFIQLDHFTQGTGLGLSICQSIVKKMKGRIGVESEGEGKGSTFWFTVPYLPVHIQQPVQTVEKPKESIESEKVTLLIAEDNESNYFLFESILGSRYNLIHAWDGVEAVELFDKHNPQLVIMDINMPKMDGYKATHEIRKKSSNVPIIAVTAYAFASDKERIMENGFNSYVSKPINAKKLDKELKSALSSRFILL